MKKILSLILCLALVALPALAENDPPDDMLVDIYGPIISAHTGVELAIMQSSIEQEIKNRQSLNKGESSLVDASDAELEALLSVIQEEIQKRNQTEAEETNEGDAKDLSQWHIGETIVVDGVGELTAESLDYNTKGKFQAKDGGNWYIELTHTDDQQIIQGVMSFKSLYKEPVSAYQLNLTVTASCGDYSFDTELYVEDPTRTNFWTNLSSIDPLTTVWFNYFATVPKEILESGNPIVLNVEFEDQSLSLSMPKYPTLQKGNSGDAVKKLQSKLIELGFLNDKADGSYGAKSEEAVKAFQASVGLEATGIADELTQEKLFE